MKMEKITRDDFLPLGPINEYGKCSRCGMAFAVLGVFENPCESYCCYSPDMDIGTLWMPLEEMICPFCTKDSEIRKITCSKNLPVDPTPTYFKCKNNNSFIILVVDRISEDPDNPDKYRLETTWEIKGKEVVRCPFGEEELAKEEKEENKEKEEQ